MKLVIQRVTSASVSIKETEQVVGKIEKGFLVLVGFKKGDVDSDVRYFANKLINLRIMPDKDDKMNNSILDSAGSILVVSQFTLNANTEDGNRPSFIESMDPDEARVLYALLIDELYERGVNVATGSFGDYMNIKAELDGPVTIILEN